MENKQTVKKCKEKRFKKSYIKKLKQNNKTNNFTYANKLSS